MVCRKGAGGAHRERESGVQRGTAAAGRAHAQVCHTNAHTNKHTLRLRSAAAMCRRLMRVRVMYYRIWRRPSEDTRRAESINNTHTERAAQSTTHQHHQQPRERTPHQVTSNTHTYTNSLALDNCVVVITSLGRDGFLHPRDQKHTQFCCATTHSRADGMG